MVYAPAQYMQGSENLSSASDISTEDGVDVGDKNTDR